MPSCPAEPGSQDLVQHIFHLVYHPTGELVTLSVIEDEENHRLRFLLCTASPDAWYRLPPIVALQEAGGCLEFRTTHNHQDCTPSPYETAASIHYL